MSDADRQHTPPGDGQEASPEDTAPLRAEGDVAVSTAESSSGGSRGGSSFDTLVGRYVVDQGLATQEEVDHCATMARSAQDPSERSLARLLVAHDYVTERQLTRLRQRIDAEKSGQQIPGYKILGKLGAGAMAKVVKAKQVSLDRTVAIKVLPKKFSNNPGFIERFYAEGRAAAQLNHPNIVQAFDVGNVEDVYYFVMEYVDGGTVHDVIQKQKRYDEREAIDVVIQVAEALEHAHNKGLIHRDVKPKNLMISRQGVVKLADMGLARAISDKDAAEAEQGKAFGTPYYISPEQIKGEANIGTQADIYSLGATLYHMVTGSVPFEGKNPKTVMSKHLKAELVPPDHVNPKLSAGISEVIEMMMAKNPRDRYRTCGDLIRDLEAVKRNEHPPLAHQDYLEEEDIASLQAAEATAGGHDIPPDRSGTPRSVVSDPAFIGVAALLAISIIFNIVMLVI